MHIITCVTIVALASVALAEGYIKTSEAGTNGMVELTVYNPYSAKVSAEVKCDYNNKIKNFEYYTKIFVPGKGSMKLNVPSRFKKCEVWPKIEAWF